jgi:predicted transcriptional regulator
MGHGQATPKLTRFEIFLQSREIMPAHLARECGYSRQHIYRIRMGQMEPTRGCMVAIVAACRRLSRSNVTAADLFPLESEEARK